MVAVLTGRLGDGASVRVTYPAAMRSSSRIRCTHALMSARCEKTWEKFRRCQRTITAAAPSPEKLRQALEAINRTG